VNPIGEIFEKVNEQTGSVGKKKNRHLSDKQKWEHTILHRRESWACKLQKMAGRLLGIPLSGRKGAISHDAFAASHMRRKQIQFDDPLCDFAPLG
jgi:hypothetical protein